MQYFPGEEFGSVCDVVCFGELGVEKPDCGRPGSRPGKPVEVNAGTKHTFRSSGRGMICRRGNDDPAPGTEFERFPFDLHPAVATSHQDQFVVVEIPRRLEAVRVPISPPEVVQFRMYFWQPRDILRQENTGFQKTQ